MAFDIEPPSRGYHHGRLRPALLEAGLELARTGGPAAVTLREVSRRAGVSHNAAYRHFSDHDALRAAVGELCMQRLGALMVERTGQVVARDPVKRAWERLEAIGRAYVDFARTEPGWFRTAFSAATPHSEPVPNAEGDVGAGLDPFLLLAARLDELMAVGALPPERRPGAEFAAWSAVHGLASLLVDGPLRPLPEADVRHATDIVLSVVTRGL